MSRSKVVAIIQAHMGSTRLPGKAMIPILDKPMLWHVANRLKPCKFIDEIVVATSTNDKDDVLEGFCRSSGMIVYRGNEFDVLDRYYRAATARDADIIVRITSDCPLIDPIVSDKVIFAFLNDRMGVDMASNVVVRTYPRGLDTEVFSFKSLEEAWREAKESHEREHVTKYIYNHPDIFRIKNVTNDEDVSYLRWTVDEKPDLKFVEEIYKRLYREGKIFFMQDILKTLEKESDLILINRDVKHK